MPALTYSIDAVAHKAQMGYDASHIIFHPDFQHQLFPRPGLIAPLLFSPAAADAINTSRVYRALMPVPLEQSYTSQDCETKDIESEFKSLVAAWSDQTALYSSLGDIFFHPAYQRIMSMGSECMRLRLILSDLSEHPRHWFYALQNIVGRDIAAGTKTFADARAAWLEWGYREGYI